MKILVIEDDELVAHALTSILTSQNYAVEVAAEGRLGWELIEAFDYDLVLLDVMLPKLDGISLCRQIRAKGLQMPILLLTGKDSGHDKAIGLDAGADDYVVKPFDTEELVARVRALLRRGGTITQPVLMWGELWLDPSNCEVTYKAQPLPLTPKEYALLELFLRNSRRVFSCSMILEHLWSYDEAPGEEAVRTHIKGLRQKLKAAGLSSDMIETVYGIGYRLRLLKSEDCKPKAEKQSESEQTKAAELIHLPSESTTIQQTLASIRQIWHRSKQRVRDQVGILEQATGALRQQELDQDLQQQARQAAHTLAGSLETFGLPEGSRLAREIEQLLQVEQSLNATERGHLQQWVKALRQEIEHSSSDTSTVSDSPATLPASALEERPLLLIADCDHALANQLAIEAVGQGFRTEVVSSLSKVKDKLLLELPDVLLLDPAISPIADESLALLAELHKHIPPIPVVIFTEQHGLKERLEVARLGARAFLLKSPTPPQVLEVVNQVLLQADQSKSQVMVVDDDPALLAMVRSLLQPWGLKVTTLSDPQQFWQVLETTSPDLLVLDIEMPQVSGIELCQVVRNDVRWSDLPIVFLTAHTNADTVNQVFSVGADDFVSKPIVGPELVTRIINRLERSRLSRRPTKNLPPLNQPV